MEPHQRVVTKMPLSELWDRSGPKALKRKRELSASEIKEQLRAGPVRFVVADAGPLRWIEPSDSFGFWKDEVKPRLVEPAAAETGFILDSFPGSYAYVASEWVGEEGPVVVLLETYH